MTTLVRRNNTSLDERDPFRELDRFVDEIDKLFERDFRTLLRPSSWNGEFTPLADIEETDDAYVLEIELPGISREDASVEVSGRRVIVSGERKERERKGIFRTKARVTGRFHYEAVLPGDIVADEVTATYKDGLLIVRAPKPESERSKTRKIQVR